MQNFDVINNRNYSDQSSFHQHILSTLCPTRLCLLVASSFLVVGLLFRLCRFCVRFCVRFCGRSTQMLDRSSPWFILSFLCGSCFLQNSSVILFSLFIVSLPLSFTLSLSFISGMLRGWGQNRVCGFLQRLALAFLNAEPGLIYLCVLLVSL